MIKKTVRLQIGGGNTFLRLVNVAFHFEETNVEIVSGWSDEIDDDPPTTLRDISIIMTEMVGQGVIDQLANEILFRNEELSMRLSLSEIFQKWSKMSEEEAEKEWNNR